MTVRAARPAPDLSPGNPAWQTVMTASKVASVLGLSPYASRFTLWHQMAGWVPLDPPNAATDRGHRLEPAVADWFADQHPEFRVRPTGSWVNKTREWQAATPDRLLRQERRTVGILECKTAARDDGWGTGHDEIPPGYRAQVVWLMDTLELPVAYVAVLLPRLIFREYVIDYDPEEAAWIREQCRTFLDTLPGGAAERVPDIDDSDGTYETVRRIHPEIEAEEVEIEAELAEHFLTAIGDERRSKAAAAEAKSRMGLAMGSASRAVHEGIVVATRQAKGGGTPYVSAPRKLPELPAARIDTGMDEVG
jgi:putative phage-type endonuclease